MVYPAKVFPNIKRGDVVHTGFSKHRNDGRYLYDGEKLVELSCELDEYGHLPSDFTLNEFPAPFLTM